MLKGLSKVFSWIVHDQIIRNWNASFNVIVQNSISLQRFKKTLLLERRRHLDENLSANCTRWSPSTQQHFGEESFIYLNCTQEFDYHVESRWSQVTCTVIQDMHCSCTVLMEQNDMSRTGAFVAIQTQCAYWPQCTKFRQWSVSYHTVSSRVD